MLFLPLSLAALTFVSGRFEADIHSLAPNGFTMYLFLI